MCQGTFRWGVRKNFFRERVEPAAQGTAGVPRPGAIKEMRGLGAKGRGFVVGLVVLADAWT